MVIIESEKIKFQAPVLRFEQFESNWEAVPIENIVNRVSIPVAVEDSTLYQQIGVRSHGKGIFYKDFVTGKSLGKKRVFWVQPNMFIVNIVFAWEQAVAKTTEKELQMIASHRFPMYEPIKDKVILDFLLYIFLTNLGRHLLGLASPGGAGRNKTLGQQNFAKIKINIPSLNEQQKIASFLNAINQKIELLTKKVELLVQHKKGVMQQIFSQQIRFKDNDGGEFPVWEVKNLGDVFERVRNKNKENNQNVMTISAQHGLISQLEYFNKSVSAKDVTGYYILQKGDFAYNKSYSKGYPMGAIKRLQRYDKGIVSTLYICFRIKNNNSESFYEHYFESGAINRELHKIAQEGARNHGLLNMSVVDFFNSVKLVQPSLQEQEKIAQFLDALDVKISQAQKKLDLTKEFKKGLLQQMFV